MTAVITGGAIHTEAIVARARMLAELTDDERADVLLRIAEHHRNGHFDDDEIAAIVHQIVNPAVVTPMLRYQDLLDALDERDRFDAYPQGYLNERDRACTPAAIVNEDDELRRQVDFTLWNLLHPRQPCTLCVQRLPRVTWQVADSLHVRCARHRSLP